MGKRLEALRKEPFRCARCRMGTLSYEIFRPLCPSWEKYVSEPYCCRGRMELAQGILHGLLSYSKGMVDSIYRCTTCGACQTQCSETSGGRKPVDVIESMRAEAADMGVGPMPSQKIFGDWIKKEYNPYGELHKNRTRWIPKGAAPLKKAELVYFVGCTSSYRQTEIAQATFKVLNAAGFKFAILHTDEWCCGSPLLRTGQRKLAEEMARHNIDAIKGMGAKRVVTTCAGCYKTLKVDYPHIFGQSFEVIHTTELLEELIRNDKIKLDGEIKDTVTYHDPCHLGRGAGVYEPPRNILKGLPGLEFLEMERNRKTAWCCGAGGGVKSAFPDWAIEIAVIRLNDAEEIRANTLVSSCPFCKRNLEDAVKAVGSPVKVFDVVELVAQSMGLTPLKGGV